MTVTWREVVADTATKLGDRTHARWMCEIASGCIDAAEFNGELDSPVTERMLAHLDSMILRRLAGEPLQYVLGSWQFRHLDLMVDRRVLIPRPETELVAEAALDIATKMLADGRRPLTIVDLGTGSGAIGLSLATELPIDSARVWLADHSADALDVARANTAGIGRAASAVSVVHGSWFAALPAELRGALDLVVSNPPYIAAGDPRVESAVTDWEPHMALFSGHDGLDAIREIAAGARSWLAPSGALVLEIGGDQGIAVHGVLAANGFTKVRIRPDLVGHDRIAIARR